MKPVHSFLVLALVCTLATVLGQRYRTLKVGVGGHCALGAAPVGPGGSFQVVERGVRKVCTRGTSCRSGACNCDNLSDGTVMGISVDSNGSRTCKRVAGQKCYHDSDCFQGVKCLGGTCTCDSSRRDTVCIDEKQDVVILA